MVARLPSALTSRFSIHGTFADGATGALFRATETSTGKEGLLKLVASAAQLTPSERGRLVRELEKLVSLHHPSLATIHAAGSAEDTPWLFREHVGGESLEQRLSRGPLASSEALGIAAQIASGLDELHRAGLLQRDLSPAHVILRDGTQQAVLIDSGIAGRIAAPGLFEVSGKPAYVSPEHAQGKLVSFRSDLYSLGAVLYEMVTGAPIYSGSAEEVLEAQRNQPPPTLSPGLLPSNITSLLGQLLQKEPRERPFSAQQVRRALEPFLPAGTAGPPPGAAAKKTLLGVPSPVSKPRGDQTEELSSLDLVRATEVLRGAPPPPPPRERPEPRADATMPLTPLDIAQAEALLRPSPSKAPPPPMMPGAAKPPTMPPPPPAAAAPKPSAPPPAPPVAAKPASMPPPPGSKGVATTLLGMPVVHAAPPAPATAPVAAPPSVVVAPAPPVHVTPPMPMTAPVAAPMVAPMPAAPMAAPMAAAPESDGLDYDDLAETKARDVESAPVGGLRRPDPFGPTDPQAVALAPSAPSTVIVQGAPSPFGAPAASSPFGAPAVQVAPPVAAVQTVAPAMAPAVTAAPVPSPMVDEVPVRKIPVAVWVALGLVGFCLVASVAGGVVGWFVTSQAATAVATAAPVAPALPPAPVPPVAWAPPTPAAPMPMPAVPVAPPVVVPAPLPPVPVAPVPVAPVPVAPVPVAPPATPPPATPPPATPPPAETTRPEARPETTRPEATTTGSSGRTRPGASGGSTASSGSSGSATTTRPSSTGGTSSGSSSTSGSSTSGTSGTGRLASRIGGGGSTTSSSSGTSGSSGSSGSSGAAASGSGSDFDAVRARASEAFRARRYDDAEREYLAATRINPRHAGSWAGLGASRLAQHNARGAVEAYRQAVSISPSSAGFHAALGRALAESGDRSGARREYEEALRLDPDNRDARIGLDRL